MEFPNIVGLVVLGCAFLVWIFTAYFQNIGRKPTPEQQQMMTAIVQLTLFPVAIIPQLIVNADNENNIREDFSPVFLVVYPTSVSLDILTQVLIKKYDRDSSVGRTNLFAMNIRLILYIIWLGQYMMRSSNYFSIPLVIFCGVVISCIYLWFKPILQTPTENETKQPFF